jgi:hypothetical protein
MVEVSVYLCDLRDVTFYPVGDQFRRDDLCEKPVVSDGLVELDLWSSHADRRSLMIRLVVRAVLLDLC